jgi:hypothetical protein
MTDSLLAPPASQADRFSAVMLAQAARRRLMGRLAGGLFFGSAVLTALVVPFLGSPQQNRVGLFVVTGIAAAVGIFARLAPWNRWPAVATLALVPPAFALIGLGNIFAGSLPYIYGLFWVVAFAWIGIAHPRWTSVWFAPLGVVAYVLPTLHLPGNTLAGSASVGLVIPVCVMVGESLAFVSERLIQAETQARRLGELYAERNRVILALQRDLLPPSVPDIPGLEVVAGYRPAGEGTAVGGDFYDVFAMEDGTWALVIGDVCGKGVEAAALTGLARYTLRAVAQSEVRPAAILRALNRAMLEQVGDSRFCTVCFIRLRVEGGRAVLTAVNAGHPLPLVIRADGRMEEAAVPGTLLGVFPDPELEEATTELGPGDLFLAYTDGVTDGRSPTEPPVELRLRTLAASWSGLGAGAAADVAEHLFLGTAPEPVRDDSAFIVARVKP